MTKIDKLSFEASYTELQAVIQKLESDELVLDESVRLYERGRLLAAHCQELLDNAELRIKKLDDAGNLSDH